VNVYIQSRTNDYDAKENGLKLVNSVVCFIAFYGLISLNPAGNGRAAILIQKLAQFFEYSI